MRKTFLRRTPRGQAMVELLVAALFFLVPLFIAIVAVGKFIDVQHTTDMAARYATWERTVWYPEGTGFDAINNPNKKSAAEINNELALRVLNDRSGTASVIKATDKSATTLANGIDPMWRDNAGTSYLSKFEDVTAASIQATPAKDILAGPLDTMAKVQVNGFLSFVPPLPTDSFAVVDLSLKNLAKTSESYQRLWQDAPSWAGMDFKASGAILSNTWGANGNAATLGMVKKMVPTAQAAGAFVSIAEAGLLPWDPWQAGRIEVGKIAVDVVPDDRLK